MNLLDFIKFDFISIFDIVLVAILMYQLYKLVRGTVAINIFIGLTSIYLLWKLVDAIHMELLSEILGQFIGVGVIILVIVFQQELRKFLIMIGKGKLIKNKGFFKFNIGEEEKMFGAVTTNDIQKKLEEKGITIERHRIELKESIKALGIFHIPVRVSANMKPELKIYVIKA